MVLFTSLSLKNKEDCLKKNNWTAPKYPDTRICEASDVLKHLEEGDAQVGECVGEELSEFKSALTWSW